MTPEESQALQQLLTQLTQIRGIEKDPEADQMIAHALARQPDAAYLLIQRTMILEQALNAAKDQIGQLQLQTRTGTGTAQATPGRSFLDANAWGNHASATTPVQRPADISATGRPLTNSAHPQWSGKNMGNGMGMQPGTAAMPGRRSSFLGGGGSMLGTMAATAAGVAGGAFLFHGIGNLLGNNDHGNEQSLADKTPTADTGGNELTNAGTSESQDLSPAADHGGGALDDSMMSDTSGFDNGGFDSDSHEV